MPDRLLKVLVQLLRVSGAQNPVQLVGSQRRAEDVGQRRVETSQETQITPVLCQSRKR